VRDLLARLTTSLQVRLNTSDKDWFSAGGKEYVQWLDGRPSKKLVPFATAFWLPEFIQGTGETSQQPLGDHLVKDHTLPMVLLIVCRAMRSKEPLSNDPIN